MDPYNSTIYGFTSPSKTPTLFLQQYKLPALPCLNRYSIPAEDDDTGKAPTVTGEGENSTQESFPSAYSFQPLELKPPTIHLVKPIKVTRTKSGSSNREFIAGISGIELSHRYMKELLLESSNTAKTEYQFTCENSDNVWCYLIDFSGYILASNQNETIDETRNERVDVGDFLGTVDPSLMRHLIVESELFDERPVYNYAALCENPLDCNSKISAAPASHVSYLLSFPLKFIISFLQSSVAFLYQLNITVLR